MTRRSSQETVVAGATEHHADALKYEDWAGEMGARWLANLTGFESTIAPAGEALLAHAAYRPGERVIDVGFGGGAAAQATQMSPRLSSRKRTLYRSHQLRGNSQLNKWIH